MNEEDKEYEKKIKNIWDDLTKYNKIINSLEYTRNQFKKQDSSQVQNKSQDISIYSSNEQGKTNQKKEINTLKEIMQLENDMLNFNSKNLNPTILSTDYEKSNISKAKEIEQYILKELEDNKEMLLSINHLSEIEKKCLNLDPDNPKKGNERYFFSFLKEIYINLSYLSFQLQLLKLKNKGKDQKKINQIINLLRLIKNEDIFFDLKNKPVETLSYYNQGFYSDDEIINNSKEDKKREILKDCTLDISDSADEEIYDVDLKSNKTNEAKIKRKNSGINLAHLDSDLEVSSSSEEEIVPRELKENKTGIFQLKFQDEHKKDDFISSGGNSEHYIPKKYYIDRAREFESLQKINETVIRTVMHLNEEKMPFYKKYEDIFDFMEGLTKSKKEENSSFLIPKKDKNVYKKFNNYNDEDPSYIKESK